MAMEKKTDVSQLEDDDDLDEEPGEVIESAPPLKVGEEREINSSGVKKKLLKRGLGWETPEFGDEVTVHYVGMLLDGTSFDSSRDRGQTFTFKLGHGQVVKGLDSGIITMKKGETALFTLPPNMAYGNAGHEGVPPNSIIQFEVELISWIRMVDVCKDGGIIKRILEEGEANRQPSDLDEVLVKYQVRLLDGTIVAKTAEEGMEFYLKDGHLIPALPKVIRTMKMGERANLTIQPQSRHGNDEYCSVPRNSVLVIDLELVSFKSVIDVTGDSKVIKKIIKEREGNAVANEGAAVTVKYIAKLEDGTIFEKKGFDGEAPLEFIVDEEQVTSSLDRAAATMKKGEQAVLTVSPDYGFGYIEVHRDLATVPPSSNLVYEVEMLDFVKEKAPWEMSSQERIEAAGKKKEEGNLLFKWEKYQRAGRKYDKAADYISEEGTFWDEEQKLAKALRVSCWLNGAACSLKLKDYKEAIKLCSKVLDIEFHNVKALYRRAQAFMENADLEYAELDIKKALEVDPENREVKLLQRNLKQRQSQNNKRDAKLYADMFSRLTKETTVAVKKLKVEKEEG
ncbi:hypothetical protein Ancab_016559 [Ancistrocladus abbreviatus]